MAPGNIDGRAVMNALIQRESGGRAGVLGPMTKYGQAQGVAQTLPGTARQMAKRLGVEWRPELLTGKTPEAAAYQRKLGAAYLTMGYEQTGNLRDALRFYHGGPDRRLWGKKTNAYADAILKTLGQR